MQFEGEDESGDVVVFTVTDIADGKVLLMATILMPDKGSCLRQKLWRFAQPIKKKFNINMSTVLVDTIIIDVLIHHSCVFAQS